MQYVVVEEKDNINLHSNIFKLIYLLLHRLSIDTPIYILIYLN